MSRLDSRPAVQAGAALLLAIAGLASSASAATYDNPAWTEAQQPFRIVGNVYYVGSRGLAAYLIASPDGLVLLDGTARENGPLVEANIRRLGFRLRDVKILLNTHAHHDHAGALARLKADTGAILLASTGDRWSLEHGRHVGDNIYGGGRFPPVKLDRTLRDGETVRLGSIAMTAVLTPGHTRGCTTWTLPVVDGRRTLQVVFPCSLSVAGNVLAGNRAYPAIADDYRRSFARVRALRADVVLPAHPELADVLGRQARQARGASDAFVDRGRLPALLTKAQAEFEATLARASRPGP